MSLLKKQRLKPWNGLKILGGHVCPYKALQDPPSTTTTSAIAINATRNMGFSNVIEWHSSQEQLSQSNICPHLLYCHSLDLYFCQLDGVDDMDTHTYVTPRDMYGRVWRILDIVRESLPYVGNVVMVNYAYVNSLGHVFRNDVQFMHGGCQDFVDMSHGGERVYYGSSSSASGAAAAATTNVLHIQRAINLVHLYGDNYYHFMVEILPRFYMIRDWLEDEARVKIILKNTPFLHLLRFIGINYEKLDFIFIKEEKELILVDELIFPIVPRCLHPSYSLFKLMRRDIFLNLHERFPGVSTTIVDDVRDLGVGDKVKIVYLSRRNTPNRRHLIGEDELVGSIRNELKNTDFEFHILYGNETQTTTLNTLVSSSVVFGPHGASFSNLIFVPTHAFVFEIVPKDYYNPCFVFLSSALGLRHYAHRGNGSHGSSFEFDDVVNVANITRWVKAKANVIKRLIQRTEK